MNIGYVSRDTSCFVLLIIKTHIHPARIFKAACDYAEIRGCPCALRNLYQDCLTSEVIPVFLDDFCLDVFSNRTSLNPLGENK